MKRTTRTMRRANGTRRYGGCMRLCLGGVAAQLDFTATPRHTKGQLFSWTVYDYPLKQAILDSIVKRPLKGIAKGISGTAVGYCQHALSGISCCRGGAVEGIPGGVAPLNRKPVLFIMMNDTAEADDVGDWLQKKYPAEFGGEKLLIIHTNRSGEMATKDLDKARDVSRKVDQNQSPVNCICQRSDAA